MKTTILNYLENTFGVSGNDATELLDLYLQTVTENCGKLDEACAAADYDKASKVAHSIKGCALNCGHAEVAELAKSMEHSAKAHDGRALAEGAATIRSLLAGCR